ncbi:MAG TPA: hypothetical protein VLI70_02360, partial [Micrococcaceae bacterium]|nr:hypothetical protein [Micrococcaceae bacterium]
LLADRFDVLLFDEPTNHLAPLLVGELEEALADFAGTLVMVSHDRALRGWFAGLERGRRLGMERGRLRRAAETAETMSVEPPRP